MKTLNEREKERGKRKQTRRRSSAQDKKTTVSKVTTMMCEDRSRSRSDKIYVTIFFYISETIKDKNFHTNVAK